MHDLDTIKRMNNETGEYLTGKAQTLAEIQAGAHQERINDARARVVGASADIVVWPERNEH